jgi:1-acyl-sn-glycerol-3-phosphate acyltransferase
MDPLLLSARVYRELGCVPHFVGHRAWFRIPLLREFMARNGVVPADDAAATARALRDDRLLVLYPGGNREGGMRSYREEPYTLHWSGRLGFVRLALEADAELIFVAALGIDEAYYQTRLPVPRSLFRRVLGREYQAMRLQLGLAGPHLLPAVFPLPVQLTHFLSPPLELADRAEALRTPHQLAALHELLWKQCQVFLDGVVARREEFSDRLDRLVRAAESLAARARL